MDDSRFVSYAQNLEDVMLWRALSGAVDGPGTYIDVGAAHHTSISVTRAFYDRGWRGLNIEPLPDQAALFRRARPDDTVIEAALAAQPGTRTFYRVEFLNQTGLSTFDEAAARRHEPAGAVVSPTEVQVETLANLCRTHIDGPIHFLKIDVEGAEADVLAGADFAAFRPWIILIEATSPLDATPADTPWEPALLAAGYHAVWFDGLNRFYVANEHAALDRHFRVQPNVFDNYLVYDSPLHDYIAATEDLAQGRLQAMEVLEKRIATLEQPPPPPPPAAINLPAVEQPAPPQPRRGLVRRLVMLAYSAVRPVVRPLAWRTRQFMVGGILQELEGHRIRLDQLIARPLAQTHVGNEAGFTASVERLMLTLALEDGRRPWPPEHADPAPRPSTLSKVEPAG